MSIKTASLAVISLAVVAAVCTVLVIFLPIPQPVEDKVAQRLCAPRSFSYDSVVCVCNSTYCDTLPPIQQISIGQALSYTSSRAGMRFAKETLMFQTTENSADVKFTIDASTRYQKLKGFGGAFTDAAGINILSLPTKAQDYLLESYFSPDGIEYNIGRIPMASCDFSTRLYTYADEPSDFEMNKFKLASEDYNYKIPLIQRALAMNQRSMSLFGSPWSAPAWMKTNNNLYGEGGLIGEAGDKYHKAWALYFSRFVEEYAKSGIHLWGLTAQNEPIDGFSNFSFQCMAFTAEEQRDFIKLDLGPTLHERGHGDLALMIGDDQRIIFPEWAKTVLSDSDAAKYVSGIGLHWYMDWITQPDRIQQTHDAYPGYFMLGTEACAGAMPWDEPKVQLGDWVRGQRYSQDILTDLNHWVAGWTDWNLALDMEGGPNWVKNFVEAPIIVNKEKGEFYKQPIFYHLGHFSKFLPEESTRIKVDGPSQDGDLRYAAFVQKDESTVVLIILNKSDSAVEVEIIDPVNGSLFVAISRHSIQTYIWKQTT